MTEVATLLAASQSAHLAAQKCRKAKDILGHLQCLSEAYERRTEAHEADPDHDDPAWAAERVKKFLHDDLLRFYRHELVDSSPTRQRLTPGQIEQAVKVPDGMLVEDSLAFQQLSKEHA